MALLLCSSCIFDGKHEGAITRCNICVENYCKRHHDQHSTRNATSFHVVSCIDEDSTQAPPPCHAAVKCGEHPGKDIEGFCDKCNIAICGTCLFGNHHGHTYRCVKVVATEKRVELTKISSTLDVYNGALATCIMHINKSEADNNVSLVVATVYVKEHYAQVRAKVDADYAQVRAKVDADEAQSTLDVTTMSKSKNKMQLGGQKLGVEFKQCEVDNLQNAVTTALASDNDAAFLQLSSDIAPRFAALQQDRPSWVLKPCTNGIVHFVPAPISTGKMGYVLDGDCDVAAAFKAEVTGDARDRMIVIAAGEKTRSIDIPLELFEVTHISPSGVSRSLSTTSAAVGTCSAALSLVDDGEHVVNVCLGSTHVNGSPIRLVLRNYNPNPTHDRTITITPTIPNFNYIGTHFRTVTLCYIIRSLTQPCCNPDQIDDSSCSYPNHVSLHCMQLTKRAQLKQMTFGDRSEVSYCHHFVWDRYVTSLVLFL